MGHDTVTGYDFTKDAPLTPKKAMKAKCLDCCGGSAHEVKLCDIVDCSLWPYRPGAPKVGKQKSKMSDENREKARQRMQKYWEDKKKKEKKK